MERWKIGGGVWVDGTESLGDLEGYMEMMASVWG